MFIKKNKTKKIPRWTVSTYIHFPPFSIPKSSTWRMMACFLGFGCSPARVGGLQLNDVDLSIFVGPRQNTALWWLCLNIAAKVVERQELGINLAGVRKHWIWERKGICYFLYFGSYFDLPEEKCSFLVILPPQGGHCIPGKKKNSSPAAGIPNVSAWSDADNIAVVGFLSTRNL